MGYFAVSSGNMAQDARNFGRDEAIRDVDFFEAIRARARNAE